MRCSSQEKSVFRKVESKSIQNRITIWDILSLAVLLLYPLRHITWGLDLWDTGYNYANFQYKGLEHMDSMWLFSTYLANALGSVMSKLPGAGSLIGMNFYTGLLVSGMAMAGYFFCTRKLQMPKWIAFLGEMVAISLCWCPTALLYNYLTYVLFLTAVMLLYLGLTKARNGYLVAAGVMLGANVLVRFSNLPEAAMIVAVWAYGVVEYLDTIKMVTQEGTHDGNENKSKVISAEEKGNIRKSIAKQTWKRTYLCVFGYLGALLVGFGYIHVRYGLDAYLDGIMRLFAMTDTATDYKAGSMVMGVVLTYWQNLYWVLRICVIVIAGLVMFGVCTWMKKAIIKSCAEEKAGGCIKALDMLCYIVMTIVAACMIAWLYLRHFCSMKFYSYDSMLRPGVLFLMLAMLFGVICIFVYNSKKEEKLLAGILILVILLTSLGSNNEVYPSLNNLFLVAPFTLWESWKYIKKPNCRKVYIGRKPDIENAKSDVPKQGQTNHTICLNRYPMKAVLVAFLLLCFVQFGGFGVKFVFAEATGVQDISGRVENNGILKGVKMPAEKAQWMTEISAFVEEEQLQGQEVILYGDIPALSYYLQMPSAFNPWSDLRSYHPEQMEVQLEALEEAGEKPVIILERSVAPTADIGAIVIPDISPIDVPEGDLIPDVKRELLLDFMNRMEYQETFRNEKFVIYQ